MFRTTVALTLTLILALGSLEVAQAEGRSREGSPAEGRRADGVSSGAHLRAVAGSSKRLAVRPLRAAGRVLRAVTRPKIPSKEKLKRVAIKAAVGATLLGSTALSLAANSPFGPNPPHLPPEAAINTIALGGHYSAWALRDARLLFTEPGIDSVANFALSRAWNVAELGDAIAGANPYPRTITADEQAMLAVKFGDSIDYARVRVKESKMPALTDAGAFVPGISRIYVDPQYYEKDYAHPDEHMDFSWYKKPLFEHEMTHVWQVRKGGPVNFISGIYNPSRNRNDGSDIYDWRRDVDRQATFDQLGIEQQAEAVQDLVIEGNDKFARRYPLLFSSMMSHLREGTGVATALRPKIDVTLDEAYYAAWEAEDRARVEANPSAYHRALYDVNRALATWEREEALQGFNPVARTLTTDERQFFKERFGDSIDLDQVRVRPSNEIPKKFGKHEMGTAIGNTIYLDPYYYRQLLSSDVNERWRYPTSENFVFGGDRSLIEEMARVWQFQNGDARKIGELSLSTESPLKPTSVFVGADLIWASAPFEILSLWQQSSVITLALVPYPRMIDNEHEQIAAYIDSMRDHLRSGTGVATTTVDYPIKK